MEKLASNEVRLADCTLERDEARPDFPVDILPFYVFLVVHKLDESIQVEEPISHVLRYDLAMEVNEYLCICAHHPLILLTCVELAAINAPAQQSGSLVLPIARVSSCAPAATAEQGLQFFHKKLACKLVSFVN